MLPQTEAPKAPSGESRKRVNRGVEDTEWDGVWRGVFPQPTGGN